jgi:hypothetical protein
MRNTFLMMKKIPVLVGYTILTLISCGPGKESAVPATAESLQKYELVEAWRTDPAFLIPESVIFDEVRNVLYVSNMNGDPRIKDGNGFISKLGLDGKIVELHWIDGLDSPKGMALVGDRLYVADITDVVEIDIDKGEISRRTTLDGIKMFNDLTSDPEGNIYATDMDANTIYTYRDGVLTEWLAGGLNAPNGLWVDGGRLLVAEQEGMTLRSIDRMTKENTLLADGINKGDGIAATGVPGQFLVSDWEGELFLIYPDYSKVSLLNTKAAGANCADIWFVPSRNLVLVPTYAKNDVVAYKLVAR